MKTVKAQLSDASKAITILFRSLFLFQIQLEKYSNELFDFQEDIQKMIKDIDQLMGKLIDERY